MIDQVRVWDAEHRTGPGPRIEAWPAGTPDARLPAGTVIEKHHTRLAISWPDDD